MAVVMVVMVAEGLCVGDQLPVHKVLGRLVHVPGDAGDGGDVQGLHLVISSGIYLIIINLLQIMQLSLTTRLTSRISLNSQFNSPFKSYFK